MILRGQPRGKVGRCRNPISRAGLNLPKNRKLNNPELFNRGIQLLRFPQLFGDIRNQKIVPTEESGLQTLRTRHVSDN